MSSHYQTKTTESASEMIGHAMDIDAGSSTKIKPDRPFSAGYTPIVNRISALMKEIQNYIMSMVKE